VIPSIVDEDQLAENIGAMGSPFNADDTRLLAARLEEIKPLYCRMCGSCQGQCAQGLPVADVLRFLMRRKLRAIQPGARGIQGATRSLERGPLRLLQQLHGRLPPRRAGGRSPA